MTTPPQSARGGEGWLMAHLPTTWSPILEQIWRWTKISAQNKKHGLNNRTSKSATAAGPRWQPPEGLRVKWRLESVERSPHAKHLPSRQTINPQSLFGGGTDRQVNASGNPVESELQGIVGAGERCEPVGPEGRQGGVDAAEAPVDTKDTLRVLGQTAAVLQGQAHFLDLEHEHTISISNGWDQDTSHSRLEYKSVVTALFGSAPQPNTIKRHDTA